MHTFDLKIDDFSKIEGKASLTVKVKNGQIEDLKFAISEFKRFYTQAIRQKDVVALPQLSSRICGTCSNAHLLCAIKAVENASGIEASEQTKVLRKLLNYGLIIRDHGLHLYVFVLPDIFGVDNILELDEKDTYQHQILHDIFEVKEAGNILSKVIGGRSVHAPFPTIGGFTKLPEQKDFQDLISKLQNARPAVLRLIEIFQKTKESLVQKLDFVALMDDEYSFLDGLIKRSDQMVLSKDDFGTYLEKQVIPYSHASGYKFMGQLHMVGALARMNLAKSNLHQKSKKDLGQVIERFPSKNIFDNNLAQAIEILHALDSSVDLLQKLEIRNEERVEIKRKKGQGIGVIEAPRGTLYYKIDIDDEGKITDGDIIVPTGQNQIGIERSIYDFVKSNLDKDKEYLRQEIEKIVRAYDPCMSCASHFLKIKWIEE